MYSEPKFFEPDGIKLWLILVVVKLLNAVFAPLEGKLVKLLASKTGAEPIVTSWLRWGVVTLSSKTKLPLTKFIAAETGLGALIGAPLDYASGYSGKEILLNLPTLGFGTTIKDEIDMLRSINKKGEYVQNIEEIDDLRSYNSPLINDATYGPSYFEDDAAEYAADILQPKTAKEIIKERADLVERKLKQRGNFASGGLSYLQGI